MGTAWGQGKNRLKDPRNIHPKTQIMMSEYVRTGGNIKKAAAKVGISPGAAKKTLAGMRDYMRQVLGDQGLTYDAVIAELWFRAHNAKNDMAAIAGLKTLADHTREMMGKDTDDIGKMTLPEVIDMLRGLIKEYDQIKPKEPISIEEGVIVVDGSNNASAPGSAGVGAGENQTSGGDTQAG